MSLAQQLVIRGLLAKFWKNPLEGSFIRWGTSLQDRFMLPHFIWEDFLEVLKDLRVSGYMFQPEWYEAQFEFRFPFYGEVHYEDVHLELRQALGPWPVLGEMGASGGTVRYTDSSVERLQVKLSAADPERYLVACNQRKTPLHEVAKKGQLLPEFASRLGNLLKLFIPHCQYKLRWCLIYLTASQKPSLVAVDTMSRIQGVEIIKISLSMNTKHKHVDLLGLRPMVRLPPHILFRRKFHILSSLLL